MIEIRTERPRSDVLIYLSGSLPKGSEADSMFSWSGRDLDELRTSLAPLTPAILNPSRRADDLNDAVTTFGRDALQVTMSDAIVVDARERRGLGVGAEMMLALLSEVLVVTIAPPDSHYRRRDLEFLDQRVGEWTHPFVAGLSDYIAEDVADAARWLRERFQAPRVAPAGRDVINESVQRYLSEQLRADHEMDPIVQEFHARIPWSCNGATRAA